MTLHESIFPMDPSFQFHSNFESIFPIPSILSKLADSWLSSPRFQFYTPIHSGHKLNISFILYDKILAILCKLSSFIGTRMKSCWGPQVTTTHILVHIIRPRTCVNRSSPCNWYYVYRSTNLNKCKFCKRCIVSGMEEFTVVVIS